MLFDGDSVVTPLFGFNIGIEVAQLVIVFSVILALTLSDRLLGQEKIVRLFLNTVVVLLVLQMLLVA